MAAMMAMQAIQKGHSHCIHQEQRQAQCDSRHRQEMGDSLHYFFKFFSASGLLAVTALRVEHVSISGQSPQVVTPFFNAH